jgi:hypothetical protein
MRKITSSDLSGGIQESTVSDDFSPRQWAQLRGLIPKDERTFESQWGIQTIGTSFTAVRAVFPLPSSDGTYLVAIKNDGSIWWSKPTSPSLGYAAANAVTWTQITTASNVAWATGDSATQPSITIKNNIHYKFICATPVEVYKYVRTPKSGDQDNVTKDTDTASSPLGIASGVIIHSTTADDGIAGNGTDSNSQQGLIAYADTIGNSVKVIVFPHIRRLATHGDEGDFINARVYDSSETAQIVGVSDGWPLTYTPSVRHHPYTYLNKDAALLPGSGVIPRANVGCLKGGILLLGDIEWRSTFNQTAQAIANVPLTSTANSELFGPTEVQAQWPNGVDLTARVIYNEGPGNIYLNDSTGVSRTITNKALSSNTVTLTTDTAHNYSAGEKVEVVNVDSAMNGIFTILATPTATTFTYTKAYTGSISSTAVSDATAKSFAHKYKVEIGQYQAIPNSWTAIYLAASVADTTVKVARQLNLATQFLNDANTGPYRGGIYFSAGELDTFDPRAVLIPGKSDVAIRGMHVLDDTVIIITSAGGEQDGVYRLRGYLSKLIQYGGTSDPTAVRIELVRGGVGAVTPTSKTHKNFSCVWSEAGIVVFVDVRGGIWFTNGQECDRLDRYGPAVPSSVSENDHCASFGNHLFVWRSNRWLCFTIMDSGQGSASGCWTQLVAPSALTNMVGGTDALYAIISGGNVIQTSPSAPSSERATYNGTALTITVSTATVGDSSGHERTTWHRFGMTFTTPTSCTVGTVKVQSTGALNVTGGVSFPDVQYTTTLNRTYNDSGVLGEFVVPAGIGPQAEASATVTFTGFVRIQSASFWVSGQDPRYGDK